MWEGARTDVGPLSRFAGVEARLGFGAWAVGGTGWGAAGAEGERAAAIRHAGERGGSFFDTAPTYRAGGAERLLGRGLKGDRERVAIATQVRPRGAPPQFADGDHRQRIYWFKGKEFERRRRVIERLRPIAQREGRSLIGLALGWLCARPGVSIVLVGAKNAAQVDETFVPDPRPLTPDTCRAIDAIVADVFRPATGTPQLGDAART